jgi:hypothetical protein
MRVSNAWYEWDDLRNHEVHIKLKLLFYYYLMISGENNKRFGEKRKKKGEKKMRRGRNFHF